MTISSLNDVVSLVHGATSSTALAKELKAFAKRDIGETILASVGPDGQDPLSVLHAGVHTLGILYILSARFHLATPGVRLEYIDAFCANLNASDAQLAPERVTLLAKGIERIAEFSQNVRLAIGPLKKLIHSYSPVPGFFTSIHCILLRVCVKSEFWTQAISILDVPLTEVDKGISDVTYIDNLTYHYLGGVIYAVLKRWKDAELFFETAVSAPGNILSAIQLEAYKKLTLVQLILYGEAKALPKHVSSAVPRQLKHPAYQRLVKAYRATPAALVAVLEKDMTVFVADCNVGLIKQVVRHAPRWIVRKLTNTYLTLSLEDIARAISLDSKVTPKPEAIEEATELILGMIERNEIYATLTPSPENATHAIVTFRDPPPPTYFDPSVIESILRNAQSQSTQLSDYDRELGKDKSYLYKAAKESNPSGHYDEMGEMGDFGRIGGGVPLDFD